MEKRDQKVIMVSTPDAEEGRTMLAALDAALAGERKSKTIVLETKEREEARLSVEALGRRKIRASPFIPLMIGAMGIASTYGGDPTGGFWPEPPKPTKKCLQCGKEHKHNNAFCSAACCKVYKL